MDDSGRAHVVLFGDSLTEKAQCSGWAAQLQACLSRRADILNRGLSGYTSRWAVKTLPRIFPSRPQLSAPHLVTVCFGTNDAVNANLPPPYDSVHVSLAEYADNLRVIVKHIRSLKNLAGNAPDIVLVAPPPVHDAGHLAARKCISGEKGGFPLVYQESVAKYAHACAQVAIELKCPFVDTHKHFSSEPDLGELFEDGVHFSTEGHRVFYRALADTLACQLPSFWKCMTDANSPCDFPPVAVLYLGDDVDWQKPFSLSF